MQKECKECKTFFTKHKNRVYCSERCSDIYNCKKFHPKKNYDMKQCPICEKRFTPKSKKIVLCENIECHKKYKSIYDKQNHPSHPYEERACEICKTKFKPKNQVQLLCGKPECRLLLKKQRHEENKEYEKNKAKEYRSKNKEKISQVLKAYRKKNYQKILMQNRIYRKKPERKKKFQEYIKKKIETDFNFRIRKRLAYRLQQAIKTYNKKNDPCQKQSNLLNLLGCNIPDFMKYLESKFVEGMSWDNYGYKGWHIDHIFPCAIFDLSKVEEQQRCFHYTNIQPMWGKENISKGARYNYAEWLDVHGMCDEVLI